MENREPENLTGSRESEIFSERAAIVRMQTVTTKVRGIKEMTRRKQGLGLFGLLAVVALGVMVFASSAQALTPKFNKGAGETGEFEVTGTQEGTGTLLVPASNLSLRCPEFEVNEGLVLTGGLIAHAKLLYKNCKAFEHKEPQAELPCHVSDVAGGKPELLHVTASALLLPVEISAGVYAVLAEKITAQINFLSGTGCPLPLKNVVKGEVCLKITSGNDTTEPLVQSNETIQGECPAVPLEGTGEPVKDKLLFGVNPAFIIGSAVLSGKGGAAGKTIGVLLL
jgi:hypothetical protein